MIVQNFSKPIILQNAIKGNYFLMFFLKLMGEVRVLYLDGFLTLQKLYIA